MSALAICQVSQEFSLLFKLYIKIDELKARLIWGGGGGGGGGPQRLSICMVLLRIIYLSKVSQRSFGAYPVIELGRGNQNAQGPGPLAHMFIYTCTSLGRTLVVRWFSRLYHMYRFRTNHNAPQWPRFIVWHINVPKRY